MHSFVSRTAALVFAILASGTLSAQTGDRSITIRKSADFDLTGDGSGENWKHAQWINVPKRSNNAVGYTTKAKMLYSPKGVYILFSCSDSLIGCTMNADLMDLWNEDVVEMFLWPDTTRPAYLEYELSPLNYELPICVYNQNREQLNSWIPFHYEGDRRTRHATAAQGGEKKSKATVTGWTTECFIPFKLMQLLTGTPHSGTRWHGNLYRIDYDKGEALFSWQLTSGDFHEYHKFGQMIFE